MIRFLRRLLSPSWNVEHLSKKEVLVLEVLGDEEMRDRELVAKSNGGLSKLTVYSILSRMMEEGLITARNVKQVTRYNFEAFGGDEKTVLKTIRFYRRGYPQAKLLKPM